MPQRVLLADPSTAIREAYAALFREEGWEVCCSHSAAEAFRAIREFSPDIMVIAMSLPDMSALEFCAMLKASEETRLIPIALLSTGDSAELHEEAFEVGAIDLISRHITPQALVARIDEIAASHPNRRHTMPSFDGTPTVLVADDSQAITAIYRLVLEQMGCNIITCRDGQEAWRNLEAEPNVDMVLTDIYMPVLDGISLCHRIRSLPKYDDMSLIVVTKMEQKEILHQLLAKGVNDYLLKPFSPEELRARLTTHLRTRQLLRTRQRLNQRLKELNTMLDAKVAERTRDLYDAQMEVIYKLATVCDRAEDNAANHIQRVRLYVEHIATMMRLPEREVMELGYSCMLHDAGKIALPESIRNKQGTYSKEQRNTMQQHTLLGEELLGDNPFFRMAREIAGGHHEHWDGSGYPRGRKGREIPLAARITAVADIFDALAAKHPPQEAKDMQEAMRELQSLAGTELDPDIVSHMGYLAHSGVVEEIWRLYPQTPIPPYKVEKAG